MIYPFVCKNNHRQEITMSFSEHKVLDRDEKGVYVECNVKYGELNNPRCLEKAYQVFEPAGFSMNYGAQGRH
jgi:hypothetical protein